MLCCASLLEICAPDLLKKLLLSAKLSFFPEGCHICHLVDVSSGREGAASTETFKEASLHNLLEVRANILEAGSSFTVMWLIRGLYKHVVI